MILYNAGKIKSFENLKTLALMVGETDEFASSLWQDMLNDEELLDEFNYYVVNRTLKGKVKCGDFTLLDLYFAQMNKYNYFHDIGRNPNNCSKERMVLHAFKQMVDMKKDPDYLKHFENAEYKSMDVM
ncbi:MAG: hypothetical protein E7263_04690 [Lachnospiraceae bacterium]|nr:hypothetical protein [Lachnospiraceae bacterium]